MKDKAQNGQNLNFPEEDTVKGCEGQSYPSIFLR